MLSDSEPKSATPIKINSHLFERIANIPHLLVTLTLYTLHLDYLSSIETYQRKLRINQPQIGVYK